MNSVETRALKLYEDILSQNEMCNIMDEDKLDYRVLPGTQFYTVKRGMDVFNSKK